MDVSVDFHLGNCFTEWVSFISNIKIEICVYHIYNTPWSWKYCCTLILNLPALSGLYKVWKKRKPKSLSQNFAFGSLIDSGNNTPDVQKKQQEKHSNSTYTLCTTQIWKLDIFIDLVPTSTAPSKGRTISWVLMKLWKKWM